ncbi:hypothetical protein N2152v2_000108 [Parachlorella kessleri]
MKTQGCAARMLQPGLRAEYALRPPLRAVGGSTNWGSSPSSRCSLATRASWGLESTERSEKRRERSSGSSSGDRRQQYGRGGGRDGGRGSGGGSSRWGPTDRSDNKPARERWGADARGGAGSREDTRSGSSSRTGREEAPWGGGSSGREEGGGDAWWEPEAGQATEPQRDRSRDSRVDRGSWGSRDDKGSRSSWERRGSSDRRGSRGGRGAGSGGRDWQQRQPSYTGRGSGGEGGSSYRARTSRESYEERPWQQQEEDDTPKAPTIRDQWVGDYIYGVSPVLAALRAGRREITALYVQEGLQNSQRKDKAAVQAARALAQEAGARVVEASKHDLNLVTDSRPHQGLVLDCGPLDFEALNSFPDPPLTGRDASGAVPLWLCLDEVMDPQNFGAALRSAFFLGVSGVLTCHRNSAPLSAVVSKASAGAMELMAIHSCRSMPQTLADAKRRGWQVLGAAAEEGALRCASFTLGRPTLLVVGNEGYGVRPVVRRLCDATLCIDGNGPGGFLRGRQQQQQQEGEGLVGPTAAAPGLELVDSLNVSVATGILLHQLVNSAPGKPAGAADGAAGGAGEAAYEALAVAANLEP